MTRDPITEKEAVALMGAHTIGKVFGFKFINNNDNYLFRFMSPLSDLGHKMPFPFHFDFFQGSEKSDFLCP